MTDDEKRELADLQRTQSRLGARRAELVEWRKEYTRVMTVINGLVGILGKRINDLKSGTGQIVSDHAVVRYLERYQGVDVESLRKEVAKLPDNKKVVINNNVITVGENINVPRSDTEEKPE